MKKLDNKLIVILFCLIGVAFAIPSLVYFAKGGTVDGYDGTFYYFINNNGIFSSCLGAIVYATLIVSSFIIYFKFIKRSNNFDVKKLFLSIFIIGIIFVLAIPNTSTDIFYYMGTGRVLAEYNQNPYYTTVSDILKNNVEDKILANSGPWADSVVVYGPLWVLITALFNLISFDSITLLLYVFKIAALLVHIINCFIVYKITGKKKMVVLYGLNPLILIEFLINVHNDIYLLFFLLLAVYFLKNKKNILLTLLALAGSALIKHLTLILVPLFILYYLKDKKILDKVLLGIFLGMLFLCIVLIFYIPFTNNMLDILSIVGGQQGKIKDSIYVLLNVFTPDNSNLLTTVYSIAIFVFAYYYIVANLKLLMYKKDFKTMMTDISFILLLFIFTILTNLTPWYLSWVFVAIFWLKGKDIKDILWIQMLYELSYTYFFLLHSDAYKNGVVVMPLIVVGVIIKTIISKKKDKKTL